MLLGCIADDFTGASDLANTLARAGLRTMQFIGVPDGHAARECEAGVVALKSRSTPVKEAVDGSLAALDWLKAQGCQQYFFKYCSTFDSTKEGNIGPVAKALSEALGAKAVIFCPAFPDAGRTVYQGHLFVYDKLLSETGMAFHPLNPMTDPDLRRWLQAQSGDVPVTHLSFATIQAGVGAVKKQLQEVAASGRATFLIADAVSNADLLTLGEALAGEILVTGGSGIGQGLARNFLESRPQVERAFEFAGLRGPGAILAGSCSEATRAQIEEHRAAGHPLHQVDLDEVMSGRVEPKDLAALILAQIEAAPLLYSSADPQRVAAAQGKYGHERLAKTLEHLFASVASILVEAGVQRLVVAGGETSGAVVSSLGVKSLLVGPEIAPGVPILQVADAGHRPLALVLKSGNFGGNDFFAKAMRMLGGESG